MEGDGGGWRVWGTGVSRLKGGHDKQPGADRTDLPPAFYRVELWPYTRLPTQTIHADSLAVAWRHRLPTAGSGDRGLQ